MTHGGEHGMTQPPTTLDWRNASHWGGGKKRLCQYCGKPSLLLDEGGQPAHKVCADAALRAGR